MGRKEQRSQKRMESQRRKKEARRRRKNKPQAVRDGAPSGESAGDEPTQIGIQHYREGRYEQARA
ncbi:MAG: hypothetical protein ACC645_00285, partial [Pirellulales bacterium]